MPGVHAVVRSHIDRWLDDQRLTPRLMGEFDDGALMKAFGQAGAGFFPWPAERRISHPAIMTVMASARLGLFPAASQRNPKTRAT
jgi:LysR family transcriptional activator of nhaA